MDRPGPAHGGGLSAHRLLAHPLVGQLLARCAFPAPGTEVSCAVSGGADSLALLALAAAAGCRPMAIHVDHGQRPGSVEEAGQVALAAQRLDCAFSSRSVTVPDGPNLEARLRAARYGALPADVLTGHTADDRAETVLLHLLRGAGPTGAIGIARTPQRPLLDLRRFETVALCDALGLHPVDDPSNRDPRFRRNRVRHELVPLLDDIAERDVVPVLVRQADLFASVDEVIRQQAALLDPTSAADLATAPDAVAGAAIRAWLVAEGVGAGYGIDAAAVARVLDVARGTHVATEVVGGWRVSRSQGRLSVDPPGA